MILSRMKDAGVILCKGKDSKIYSAAMYECLLNPSNMDRYLNEDGVLRFKDHENNSKGKLIKCKAVIE